MKSTFNVVVLVAYPLGGKDTQSKLLIDFINQKSVPFLYIATGNEFGSLGKLNYTSSLIRESIKKGSLAPDFMATGLVVNSIIRNFDKDMIMIFNGFPRSKEQGKSFSEIMEFYNLTPKIIFIKTEVEDLMKRLAIRQQTEQRVDDTEEVVKKRLNVFKKENASLIHYLKSNFYSAEVDGSGTPEEVHWRILKALGFVE